jgi:hypothetical protein
VVAQIEGRQLLVGSSRFMKTEGIDISASEQFKTGGVSLAYRKFGLKPRRFTTAFPDF